MTAAIHPTLSTRWLEALVEPIKTALRHPPIDAGASQSVAEEVLHSPHPAAEPQHTVGTGDLPNFHQTNSQLVLPATLPARMLLLSADDGITTTLSMLGELQARNYQGDVVLLHVCRNPAELTQAQALQSAADSFPELSLLVHFRDYAGQFTAEALKFAVPDVNQRSGWLCGPSGFVEMVQAYWRGHGLTAPLHSGPCLGAPTQAASPDSVAA